METMMQRVATDEWHTKSNTKINGENLDWKSMEKLTGIEIEFNWNHKNNREETGRVGE